MAQLLLNQFHRMFLALEHNHLLYSFYVPVIHPSSQPSVHPSIRPLIHPSIHTLTHLIISDPLRRQMPPLLLLLGGLPV